MPLDLDSCIAGIFTPGNIGASSGLPPVEPVWIPHLGAVMYEAAHAAVIVNAGFSYSVAISEAASASDFTNIAGSSYDVAIAETASAADAPAAVGAVSAAVTETASADTAQDAALTAPTRSAMVPGVFINPSTSREANANGVMVNL